METSIELQSFKNHFEFNTGIKVLNIIEERNFFHWKRLVFSELNCDQLITIGNYIKTFFHEDNKYYEYNIKLHTYNNISCLTCNVDYIKKFILPTI